MLICHTRSVAIYLYTNLIYMKKAQLTLENLEKATAALKEIKYIEKEIALLDRFIGLSSTGNVECSFGLKIQERNVLQPVGDIFDQYGGLKAMEPEYENVLINTVFGQQLVQRPKPPSTVGLNFLNYNIEESTTLLILGILLKSWQRRKEELQQSLTSLGIKI